MSGEKILIVDDTPHLRLLVSKFLKRAGFEVIEAGDGVEALRAIQLDEQIGLVMLDLMMPKMNGNEFLNRVGKSKVEFGLKICVMSAVETLESVKDCLRKGADDYLIKPVDELILVNKAKTLLMRTDINDFCVSNFECAGSIVHPNERIEIKIAGLSECSVMFTADINLPIGARVFLCAPPLQALLGKSEPVLIRIVSMNSTGGVIKYVGAFMGLKDTEYKRLRSNTTKGGEHG